MLKIKSPLRYPGGKSRAIDQILPQLPPEIAEYREPFIGGGSVFLAIQYLLGDSVDRYWINDLNPDLYCFWKYSRDSIDSLVEAVKTMKQKYPNGRELFQDLTRSDLQLSEFDRAVRFFILNRITFSGTVDSGGYSQQAFERRFTDSSIDRLQLLSPSLAQTKITNQDYEHLLVSPGKRVFIFLDPPYFSATKSKLYGVKGNLHTNFDHERFAEQMRTCPHQWLITYDDSPEIRQLFSFAKITEWTLQYGMNNYKQSLAAAGRELFIKNY
jgi:DNA adenine methylase